MNGIQHPRYDGFGGLPFNIEYIVRKLEAVFGNEVPLWEIPLAYFELRHILAEIEHWWDKGGGAGIPKYRGIMQNLAVWGWDLRDDPYNVPR
jgi:hypothetical protein